MLKYAYLLATLPLLIAWAILYILRKDVRKKMLVVSLIFGIMSPIVEPLYLPDWWHPLTITGTPVGAEDFFFGFAIAGLAAVIYEEIFKKRIKPRRIHENKNAVYSRFVVFLLALFFFLAFTLFKFLPFSGSYAGSYIGLIIGTVFMWSLRSDLIVDSLVSGFLVVLLSFICYWLPEFFVPDWVARVWYPNILSQTLILGAPLGDLIYLFLVGTYIGPIYEYWQNEKLVALSRS